MHKRWPIYLDVCWPIRIGTGPHLIITSVTSQPECYKFVFFFLHLTTGLASAASCKLPTMPSWQYACLPLLSQEGSWKWVINQPVPPAPLTVSACLLVYQGNTTTKLIFWGFSRLLSTFDFIYTTGNAAVQFLTGTHKWTQQGWGYEIYIGFHVYEWAIWPMTSGSSIRSSKVTKSRQGLGINTVTVTCRDSK